MQRRYNIDLLRIICAMAVIVIHVVAGQAFYSSTGLTDTQATTLNVIRNIMNFSVPCFFMITGYCISLKKECSYKYCLSHVVKYVSVLMTIGLFYALLEEVFVSKTINLSVIFNAIYNVIIGETWSHMWFVYAIIGIYLVLPVLHSFFQTEKQNVYMLTILLFFFTIFCYEFQEIIPIGVQFPFGGYLFYVCLGASIEKYKCTKTTTIVAYVIFVVSIIWILLVPNYHFKYLSIQVSLLSASIFIIINALNIKPNKFILTISKCTWGIYLIHPFFMNIATKALKINFFSSMPYIKLSFFFIVILIISFICTYILKKIPIIQKLF